MQCLKIWSTEDTNTADFRRGIGNNHWTCPQLRGPYFTIQSPRHCLLDRCLKIWSTAGIAQQTLGVELETTTGRQPRPLVSQTLSTRQQTHKHIHTENTPETLGIRNNHWNCHDVIHSRRQAVSHIASYKQTDALDTLIGIVHV